MGHNLLSDEPGLFIEEMKNPNTFTVKLIMPTDPYADTWDVQVASVDLPNTFSKLVIFIAF